MRAGRHPGSSQLVRARRPPSSRDELALTAGHQDLGKLCSRGETKMAQSSQDLGGFGSKGLQEVLGYKRAIDSQ